MMKSVPRKALLVGSAAAGVLALGIAVPAVALAQDPTPSASSSPSTSGSASGSTSASTSAEPGSDAAQKRAEHRDRLAEALATELGLPKERVAGALDKVLGQMEEQARSDRQARLKERLDAAVKEGKLTQAQADAILKAAEEGVLPGGPGGRRGPGPR